MPNSILWIGLVVLWVFVLFPMLTSRHPRIRQHTDAALSTRVLHRGDDTERRIRKGPASGHDTDPDYVPVRRKHHHSDDPEDRMTKSDDSTAGSDDEDFETARERHTESSASVATQVEVIAEPAEPVEPERESRVRDAGESQPEAAIFDSRSDIGEPDRQLGDEPENEAIEHSATASESDLAEPATPSGGAEPEEPVRRARHKVAPPQQATRVPALRDPEPEHEEFDESDSEDPDFVPSRRGRGGYDPEADAIARVARYTFRQRAVLGLVLGALLFAAAGLALSPVLWWLSALSGTVLVGYLAYLRRQVHLEEEIRRRRTSRLRKHEDDAEQEQDQAPDRPRPDKETARSQLRRAVLVEPDDEDPVFENLELFDAASARATRQRAAGSRDRRAVGE
ncbi:divisome protein SepX/GlpR [Nocardia jejuensis]|uniref:divisome protein SepX/GlpR n=1 Tax=Nocardia jejuensis TaxID=328049 RepID=UPI00082A1027|nr:gephyrin-like molybdotransferase receptor GlpR [Nocardia jejuensis]